MVIKYHFLPSQIFYLQTLLCTSLVVIALPNSLILLFGGECQPVPMESSISSKSTTFCRVCPHSHASKGEGCCTCIEISSLDCKVI